MLEITTLTVDDALIDELHKNGKVDRASLFSDNVSMHSGFVVLTGSNKKSALCCISGEHGLRVVDTGMEFMGVRPRDKQQLCMLWSIMNKNLTVALGSAGTGKTTLALAYGVNALMKDNKTLVLCKPTKLVGGPSDAWGTLPGGTEEKMQPYAESFLIPMRKLLGDVTQTFMDRWISTGKLVIQPLETIRGMSFEGATVILDEAQNCTLHELMSFVSRIAADSKCIVMGDPGQIDVDMPWRDTGLCLLLRSDSFDDTTVAAGVRLEAQYRGPLAHLAAEVLREYSTEYDEE